MNSISELKPPCSLSTTIGYGHLTPAQPAIRMVSLLYGLVSLPLVAALVAQLSTTITSIINLSTRHSQSSLFLTFLLLLFLTAGAVMFSVMFQWEPADSIYFVMTTLSTIGFGDLLPGDSLTFLLCGGYIVLGLALFNIWQQSVVVSLIYLVHCIELRSCCCLCC